MEPWRIVEAQEGAGSHPRKELGPLFGERVSENTKWHHRLKSLR